VETGVHEAAGSEEDQASDLTIHWTGLIEVWLTVLDHDYMRRLASDDSMNKRVRTHLDNRWYQRQFVTEVRLHSSDKGPEEVQRRKSPLVLRRDNRPRLKFETHVGVSNDELRRFPEVVSCKMMTTGGLRSVRKCGGC
jgi:hypothetical protein